MRIETILRICKALQITPDDILTEEYTPIIEKQNELIEKLNSCKPNERQTALQLLYVYLESIKKYRNQIAFCARHNLF